MFKCFWLVEGIVHDKVGRGFFLAIYISSGMFGSMLSLSGHVLRSDLITASLGASGAVSGILAASCIIHAQ